MLNNKSVNRKSASVIGQESNEVLLGSSQSGRKKAGKGFGNSQSRSGNRNTRAILNTDLEPTKKAEKQELEVHLDYLRTKLALSEDRFSEFMQFIEYHTTEEAWVESEEYREKVKRGKRDPLVSVLPDQKWTLGKNAPKYDNGITSPFGMRGGYSFVENEDDPSLSYYDVMIDWSGVFFTGLSFVDSWRMIKTLKEYYEADCSRVDIAVDDLSCSSVPIQEMRDAYDAGNIMGFSARDVRLHQSTPHDPKEITDYYGSRHAGKLVRVYHHKSRNENDPDCYRFEFEAKRQYSRIIFDAIACLEREFPVDDQGAIVCASVTEESLKKCAEILSTIKCKGQRKAVLDALEKLKEDADDFEMFLQKLAGTLAVSAIDFRNKGEQKDPSKASFRDTKRLPFYQDFVDMVGTSIKLRVPKRESTIATTMAWMRKSWVKTLAIMQATFGLDFIEYLDHLKKLGNEKLLPSDYKKIAFLRQNRDFLGFKSERNPIYEFG